MIEPAQLLQMGYGLLLGQLRGKFTQGFIHAPIALLFLQVLADRGEQFGKCSISSSFLQQSIHGLIPVVLLFGGHAKFTVQTQIAGKWHHHATSERIDGANSELRPMMEHVRERLRGAPLHLICGAIGLSHHRLLHIDQLHGQVASSCQTIQIVQDAFAHFPGCLVREGQREDATVCGWITGFERQCQVMLDQCVCLTRTGGASENA